MKKRNKSIWVKLMLTTVAKKSVTLKSVERKKME